MLLTLLKASGGGGVAISVVGIARTPSDGTDATGASLALTIPAGTAVDDYAVAIIELWDSTATNPTLTYPSGFSQIVNYVSTTDGFQKLKVAIKKLTAADSGTYSVSGFASHFRQGHVAILRGIDTTTALDVAVNLAQNSTGTALPANAITTTTDGCLLMHVVANENTCTGTPPTGYTEQADSNYLKTNTKIQSSAGADTISGGSFSASTLKLGALIAFRPAAGGGSVTADAALSGTATLSGSGTSSKPVDAALSTTATLAGTGISSKPAAASLTATAALTADATVGTAPKLMDAALAVTANLTATDTATKPIDGALSSTASLSGSGTGTKPAGGTLAVTQTGTASAGTGVVANLAETATLTATGTSTKPSAASLAVTANLIADLSTAGQQTANAALSVTATASGTGLVDNPAAGNLAETVSLVAAAVPGRVGSSSLAPTATLAAAAQSNKPAAAALAAAVTLTATLTTNQAIGGQLAVNANLTATGGSFGGVTYRPDLGTTARPSTGITPRPNTGTTPRP